MAATVPCVPACCSTTQTVNIPGEEGPAGPDGANGVNAYGLVTVPFDVPAVGATVGVAVDNGIWMVQGQKVVFDGPATFEVVSVNSPTSVTLEFMGYADDVSPGTTIPVDAGVSPSGTQPELSTLSVYASGTPYSLTATPAKINFGTTDPALIITSPGTWKLEARVRIDANGKTTAAGRTLTILLRRTNNGAADIPNTTGEILTEIITTLTQTLVVMNLPLVAYVTLNADDQIEMWGSADNTAGVGTFDVVEASIFATKIS